MSNIFPYELNLRILPGPKHVAEHSRTALSRDLEVLTWAAGLEAACRDENGPGRQARGRITRHSSRMILMRQNLDLRAWFGGDGV